VYGSGGFTSYTDQRLQQQLSGWAEQGIRAVKMKVGTHPHQDLDRVKAARMAIGQDVALYVDANGAFHPKQALEFAQRFSDLGVSWFEEPVSSDDVDGLALIRTQGPAGMDIAAGEYGYDAIYFNRMLQAGAVDILQADATRCGGVTGFMQAASLCEGWQTPLSAHTSPSIHAHLCCCAPRAMNVEYFYDHVRIESKFFDGALTAVNGELRPDRGRPGLGLELKRKDAEKLAA
jgi:L-alanine-DL-glutamate epimerase-like enolase superfamily enzyme